MLMCGLLLGMEILNLRYIGGGLWGPTFFGFLGGAASILIKNRVRKKPPENRPCSAFKGGVATHGGGSSQDGSFNLLLVPS